jgi:hypothetical protein
VTCWAGGGGESSRVEEEHVARPWKDLGMLCLVTGPMGEGRCAVVSLTDAE